MRLERIWQAALVRLGLAWLALIALFRADWAAMADQWWNSSTYTHVLLIPPIIVWLITLRWRELIKLSPSIWLPGLLPFSLAVLLWVLGSFAGLSIAQQAGAVAMLPTAALVLLGPKCFAGLLFPFAYMVFLVPFGDELVPPLQMITARITVFLTHASAIPAAIDGVFIDTPAGLFEVAEACSGVKFLIAMVAFGVLAAHVCFTSWRRRVGFMALAIIAPILANGIRAWGTIYVAQFKGAAFAGGFDHIVYGWLFFAVVIALVLLVSWRFFDRPLDDPMISAAAIGASPVLGRLEGKAAPAGFALALLAILTLAGQGWAHAAARLSAPIAAQIVLPEVPGWQRIDYAPRVWWEPRALGADHRLLGRYRDAQGHEVDVFFALYAAQGEGREAGGFGEGALRPDSPWSWESPGPALSDGHADVLLAQGRIRRLTETHYRTGDLTTGSNARLKLANIADRLGLRAQPTMLLILSSEDRPGQPGASSLAAFRASAGPLGQWMDRMGQVR